MIYTIGYTEAYERGLDEAARTKSFLSKKGRGKGYTGGSVWKTYAEALIHARERGPYLVYGVLADWEIDTEPSSQGDWHDLLINARLVRVKGVENVNVGDLLASEGD